MYFVSIFNLTDTADPFLERTDIYRSSRLENYVFELLLDSVSASYQVEGTSTHFPAAKLKVDRQCYDSLEILLNDIIGLARFSGIFHMCCVTPSMSPCILI